ncbi:heat shock 70 kDa protein 12A-like [Ruditapes philippinarum]|uniref:heat shock 70 kDa protein 12A-like n=1 Tax=Ruditapes philippinarum TaxID=129788 RepID=UPI00295C1331|nr:heat shock 70 kDa protein 12A-like [Ruditapes philippinarum]
MGAAIQPTARQQTKQSNESRKKESQDSLHEDNVDKPLIKEPTARQQTEHSNESRHKESQDSLHEDTVDNPLVVVAIDFGTVHSGFAYSFKGNENNIKSGEHGGMLQEDRVPTILLLKPDKTFHSFGYKAQTDFHELSQSISSDSARQFMREASTKAGIPETHLRHVLEPEAAALYSTPLIMTEAIPCGFMYILADLGGGTTDICAHKIIDGGKIQEIYRTTGEASGGRDVDDCFINMMKTLIGEKVWSEFSTNHPSACVSLVNEFRLKKKEFKSQTNNIQLRMENALVLVLTGENKNLNDIVKKSKYVRKLDYNSMDARLTINREMLEELFKPSVDKIISKLVEVLDQCDENEIKTIILVGGYSESPYVRERIQSQFSNMRVILVDDARLAVVNGAVMMGWKPKNIIQRRSRYTYGFAVYVPFREGIDPEQFRINIDGDIYCNWRFKKMIEKGQIVEYGQTFISEGHGTATIVENKYEEKYLPLYRSTREDPQYCIEEDCSLVGIVILIPPSDGWPDTWDHDLHLIVGETEFTVKYFNLDTGEEYEAQMDFL